MSVEKKHSARKSLKVISIVIGVLFVGILIGRFLLTTNLAHQFVENKIQSIAKDQLQASLIIEGIDGDLWKEIELSGIVVMDTDTIFSSDKIYASYNVWSFLGDTYEINAIKSEGSFLNLDEQADSLFNVQKLVNEEQEEEGTEGSGVKFEIHDIELSAFNVQISSATYLPDTLLSIRDLNLNASYKSTDTFSATLSSLDFYVEEGRLPEPIRVKASASAEEERISLESLMLETSKSVLSAKAGIDTKDCTMTGSALSSPLSLADVGNILDTELIDEDLSMSVEVSGALDNLEIVLRLDHQYVPNFELMTNLDTSDEFAITNFGIAGDGIDIAMLTKDSIKVKMGDFRASFSGELLPDLIQSDVIWGFSFTQVRMEDYYFDSLIANGTYKNDDLIAHFGINSHQNEQLNISPNIYNASTDTASWEVGFDIEGLNAGYWLANDEIQTQLYLTGAIEGRGYNLSENPIKFSFGNTPIFDVPDYDHKINRINGQEFSAFGLRGSITETQFSTEGQIEIEESGIDLNVTLLDFLTDQPTYTYSISSEGFDASSFEELSELPTHINIDINGEGEGLDFEECSISAEMHITSSIVNGAALEEVMASLHFSKGVLDISEGRLRSDIADGFFTGRKNVTDETDPENWLNADLLVKNIQPLAPLVGADRLSAEGVFRGRVTQDTTGVLAGTMNLDLEDIRFDSVFTSSQIVGDVVVQMKDFEHFDLNLDIQQPLIKGITFQDINLISEGIASEDTLDADFSLEIVGSDRGRLVQEGVIIADVSEELIKTRFDKFDFITNDSELSITRPFNVQVLEESISTDTLDLISTGGAFLALAIPYADSLEQYGWVQGQNFDVGLLLEVIFGERFIDGVLSGDFVVNKSSEETTGNGALSLERLKYGELEADLLTLQFEILRERLEATGVINWDGEDRVVGNLDVPFVLGRPEEMDDDFFAQPVEGSLSVKPSELARFKTFLTEFGITDTDGILSFDGTMSGTAGDPDFQGEFELDDPTLSGITVDSAIASFNYDIQQGGLRLEASVMTGNQRAADIDVVYPLEYDFRSFEVVLPDEEDDILIYAKTDAFNLAVLNDFLDEEYMRGLTGSLDAEIILQGNKDNLVPTGYLRLTDSEVTVPNAGITLTDIRSNLEFTQEGLAVNEFHMKSGSGSLNAEGAILLEGIYPETLDLNIWANQFRLANTNDYNMVIDLRSGLKGKAVTPEASGEITVRSGFYRLQDFGENSVEEVLLEGEEASSFSPYDSLSIDMEIEIQRDFYVRNANYPDMEIELTGNLDVQKPTNEELSLFGSLEGREGYMRPLGKIFTMEESSFIFSGPVDDPELFVRGKYIPPTRQKGESIELFYIIEGTQKEPQFRFESNPEMEEQEVICYTLFANPCVESWQQILAVNSNTSTRNILTDVLLDEVEALATRELGVDVVQIDNTSTTGSTSIKTGWYLNERTFFAIINEISGSTPRTLFQLEYILSRYVDLIVTQSADTRNGIDLRYQFDY